VPVPSLTFEQQLALQMLATTPNGCTYWTLRARGVSLTDMDELLITRSPNAGAREQAAGQCA
jgi:hypothetical protein